ncbi:MAG: hypothetical protein Kow00128_10530 [Deltaproteobacteria bacterium]
MSAKKSEVRYYPKPYVPEPDPPPVRSLLDVVKELAIGGLPCWPELRSGERGADIGKVLLRDLTIGTPAAGGNLKATSQPTTAIEHLGAILATGKAGAVTIPVGADGFSAIPTVEDPGTGYWITEGNPVTETNLTFGTVTPSLKTVGASCDLSRLLPALTGPFAEQVVSRELFGVLARAVDAAALHGDGTGGSPVGIENASGVDVRSGASFAAATAAAMLRAIEDGNADSMAANWIMAPDVAELLRKREAATGSGFLIDGNGKMLNIPVFVSNSVNAGCVFLGTFAELVFLVRSLELQANPYSKAKTGMIEVTAFWSGDVVVRHPACFALATGTT